MTSLEQKWKREENLRAGVVYILTLMLIVLIVSYLAHHLIIHWK